MCGKCNNIKALHQYYKYCPYCGEQIRTDEELENKILENKRDMEERKRKEYYKPFNFNDTPSYVSISSLPRPRYGRGRKS